MNTLFGVGLFAAGFITGGVVAVIAVACVVVGGGE